MIITSFLREIIPQEEGNFLEGRMHAAAVHGGGDPKERGVAGGLVNWAPPPSCCQNNCSLAFPVRAAGVKCSVLCAGASLAGEATECSG